MTLNTFFSNYTRTSEQNLLEDLIIEAVQMYGQEIFYLPRRRQNFDQVFYADDQSHFDTAYPIEMYIKSVDGFSGDKVFMSKFDIEVRDQIIFSISRRRFELVIGAKEELLSPREGDLIYFPINNKIFQIMFSDNKPYFYQLGNLQLFDVTCEAYEMSSEKFSTGIDAIDSIAIAHSQNILDYSLITHDGYYLVDHDGHAIVHHGLTEMTEAFHDEDNKIIQTIQEHDDIINFTEQNPYAERNPY